MRSPRVLKFMGHDPVPLLDPGEPPAFDGHETRTITMQTAGAELDDLSRTRNAVFNEFGRGPTHFLVGWWTFLELRWLFEQHQAWASAVIAFRGSQLTFMNAPIIPDPLREQGIVAVPPIDFLIGRELPAACRWDP